MQGTVLAQGGRRLCWDIWLARGKQGCSRLKERMFKANRNHGLNLGGACQEWDLSFWPWAVHAERASKSWQLMCSVKWASTRGCKCWYFILYCVSRSKHPHQALVTICALRNSSYLQKTESFIQTRSKIEQGDKAWEDSSLQDDEDNHCGLLRDNTEKASCVAGTKEVSKDSRLSLYLPAPPGLMHVSAHASPWLNSLHSLLLMNATEEPAEKEASSADLAWIAARPLCPRNIIPADLPCGMSTAKDINNSSNEPLPGLLWD